MKGNSIKKLKTAKIAIKNTNKFCLDSNVKISTALKDTLEIYRSAVSFFINVADKEKSSFISVSSNEVIKSMETLTHRTKNNTTIIDEYDFSKDFYKFPSYLRRASIMEAVGIINSHYSRVKNWEKKKELKESKGKKFYEKKPTLQFNHNSFPTLYKGNMFKQEDNSISIKVFLNNDWKWIKLDTSNKALKTSKGRNRFTEDYKPKNPMLMFKDKKFTLNTPYEIDVKLKKVKLEERKIISVDMGLTNSAVCSCMDSNGTVIDRLFINQPIEKDRLITTLNRISKVNSINESVSPTILWAKVNRLQQAIKQDTVNKILDFAKKHNVYAIVFEHLGKFKGKNRGKFGRRILFWAYYRGIQQMVMEKAHSYGIRLSRVLASGTSKYAFDGSGEVKRNPKKDIAVFSTGKIYNCDLSASYNIGARYYIREILKSLSEKLRLEVEAKVPLLSDRSCHTVDTLIRLRGLV